VYTFLRAAARRTAAAGRELRCCRPSTMYTSFGCMIGTNGGSGRVSVSEASPTFALRCCFSS